MKLEKVVRRMGAVLLVLVWTSFGAVTASAQTQKTTSRIAAAQGSEKNGELQLAAARANPLQLRQFLKKMPKGADLHYHLSGGVYAETFVRDGVDDGLCIDVKQLAFAKCTSSDGD